MVQSELAMFSPQRTQRTQKFSSITLDAIDEIPDVEVDQSFGVFLGRTPIGKPLCGRDWTDLVCAFQQPGMDDRRIPAASHQAGDVPLWRSRSSFPSMERFPLSVSSVFSVVP